MDADLLGHYLYLTNKHLIPTINFMLGTVLKYVQIFFYK